MKSSKTSNRPNRKPNWFYQFGLQVFKRVSTFVLGTRKFLRRSVRKFFSFPSTNWITSKILPDSESSKPPVWYQYLNPIAWFSWWMRFFAAWIVSRPYSAIGPALPAIVFVAFVLFATLKVKQSSQSDLRNAYTDAMARSMADANYDRAVVAADRLVDLFPRDFSFRMDRARIEIARGNDAAANMYFEQLASEGHAPALLWIASKRFDLTQTAKWTADEHAEFNRIYATLIATARGRDLVLAKKTLASYLIATGSLQLAKETLKELLQTGQRDLLLPIATVSKQLGQNDDMRLYASEAKEYFLAELQKAPGNRQVRTAAATSMLLLGDWKASIRLWNEGYHLAPDRESAQHFASTVAAAASSMETASKSNPTIEAERMSLLVKALSIAPDNPDVIEQITDILIQTRSSKSDKTELLRKSLLTNLDSNLLHFVEGTISLLDGDVPGAMVHLNIAKDSGLVSAGVINNLAVAVAEAPSPNLEEALRLANVANELLPDHPYLRETRGQIYFKMGNLTKAIPDLEFAVRAPELKKGVYQSLSEIYKSLGQDTLSQEYANLKSKL